MSDEAPQGPPGRRVVVVREGPSKKRPIIVDAAVGIVGLLLLLGSIALVDILPEDPPVVPQYKAAFNGARDVSNADIQDLDTGSSLRPENRYTLEGQAAEWNLAFTHENIYQVTVVLILEDDHKASLPDLFRASLVAPNGTVFDYPAPNGLPTIATIPIETDGSNLEPEFWQNDPTAPQVATLVFPVNLLPPDYLFTVENLFGEPGDFELWDVESALQEHERIPETVGTWTLRVELIEAGACPEASPQNQDVQRPLQCQIQTAWENSGGDPTQVDPTQDSSADPGNPVRMAQVTYNYFTVEAEEA